MILKRSLIVIRAHIQDSTSQRRTRKHSSGRWLYFGHVGSVEQSKPKRSRFLDRCLFILAEQLVSEDVVAIKLRSLWHLDCTHSHKAIPHHVQIPDLEKTKQESTVIGKWWKTKYKWISLYLKNRYVHLIIGKLKLMLYMYQIFILFYYKYTSTCT